MSISYYHDVHVANIPKKASVPQNVEIACKI